MAVGSIVTDIILFFAFLNHGYTFQISECFIFGTVLSISKCIGKKFFLEIFQCVINHTLYLGLLGSIPSMLDIACNCYAMVGTLGWVEVVGDGFIK